MASNARSFVGLAKKSDARLRDELVEKAVLPIERRVCHRGSSSRILRRISFARIYTRPRVSIYVHVWLRQRVRKLASACEHGYVRSQERAPGHLCVIVDDKKSRKAGITQGERRQNSDARD